MDAPPAIDLRAAAVRVLTVINQMLCHHLWKTRIERRMPEREGAQPAYAPIENATIESSLINIRTLYEVFARRRRYPDDLHQSDFPGFHFNSPFLTREQRDEINKQIAHLTHATLNSGDQKVSYKDFLRGAIPAAEKFCQYLDTLRDVFGASELELIKGTSESLNAVSREYLT